MSNQPRPKHLEIESSLSNLTRAIEDVTDFRREIMGESAPINTVNASAPPSNVGEATLADTLDTLATRLNDLSDKLHIELEALNSALF